MEIITRAEARKRGLTRYFTGKPCKHGHIVERITSSGCCVVCNRVRQEGYRNKAGSEIQAAKRRRYAENPDATREAVYAWRRKNIEKARLSVRRWQEKNRQKTRDAALLWALENPEKHSVIRARRRAAKARAVPPWYGELDELVWVEAADLIKSRRAATGIRWHSDHMIPLRASAASGLHVWNNCQVIPAVLNCSKKQQMIMTEPFQWLYFQIASVH